jgi:hypothetical protein
MDADSLFLLAGMLVLPGWFLLIFLPRWKYSAPLVAGFRYLGFRTAAASRLRGKFAWQCVGIC